MNAGEPSVATADTRSHFQLGSPSATSSPVTSPNCTAVCEAEFHALMGRLGGFEKNPTVAVAVSGGADSMALAILTDRWVRRRRGKMVALTGPGHAAARWWRRPSIMVCGRDHGRKQNKRTGGWPIAASIVNCWSGAVINRNPAFRPRHAMPAIGF